MLFGAPDRSLLTKTTPTPKLSAENCAYPCGRDIKWRRGGGQGVVIVTLTSLGYHTSTSTATMLRLLLALLHLLLPYILAATPSEITVADLTSHLEFLESATEPHDSRVNFELGLTYQLLADATNTDDAAGVDVIFALGVDSLRSKAEEFYTACLAEDPSNAVALSNLAQLISAKNLDDTSITIITDLYERAISSIPMHIQSVMNYRIFLRQKLGRYQDAIEVFNLGLLSHPNSILMR